MCYQHPATAVLYIQVSLIGPPAKPTMKIITGPILQRPRPLMHETRIVACMVGAHCNETNVLDVVLVLSHGLAIKEPYMALQETISNISHGYIAGLGVKPLPLTSQENEAAIAPLGKLDGLQGIIQGLPTGRCSVSQLSTLSDCHVARFTSTCNNTIIYRIMLLPLSILNTVLFVGLLPANIQAAWHSV
jgi:hypothetical protein